MVVTDLAGNKITEGCFVAYNFMSMVACGVVVKITPSQSKYRGAIIKILRIHPAPPQYGNKEVSIVRDPHCVMLLVAPKTV